MPKSIVRRLQPYLFLVSFGVVGSAQAVAPKAVMDAGGMVASRSALASDVGAQILADGGNAIDAAVGVGFAMAVTYPSAGNIGGGGFMVIHLADGTVVANDHRERAPGAASKDMFLDDEGQVKRPIYGFALGGWRARQCGWVVRCFGTLRAPGSQAYYAACY